MVACRQDSPPSTKENQENEICSTKLINNELNAHTDWDAIRKDLKDQGISLNKLSHLNLYNARFNYVLIHVLCPSQAVPRVGPHPHTPGHHGWLRHPTCIPSHPKSSPRPGSPGAPHPKSPPYKHRCVACTRFCN